MNIKKLLCITLSTVMLVGLVPSVHIEALTIGYTDKVDVSRVKVPKSKTARLKKAAKLCGKSYKEYLKGRKEFIKYAKTRKGEWFGDDHTIGYDVNVVFKLDQELYAYNISTEGREAYYSFLHPKEREKIRKKFLKNIKKFWKKFDSVMSGLNLKGKSDYEKVKAIQDWLTKNVTYDYDCYNYGCNKNSYNAYGALLDGRAVCEGYADLAILMFMKADLPVVFLGNDDHAFNAVEVDGKWYYIDTCWAACGWGTRWFLKNKYDFTHNDDGSIVDSHITKLDKKLGIKIAKNSYPIPEADQPKSSTKTTSNSNTSKKKKVFTIADVPSDKYQEFSQEYYSYPALANKYSLESYISSRYMGSIGSVGLIGVPDWAKQTSTSEPTMPTPKPVVTPEPMAVVTPEPVPTATPEPIPDPVIITSNDLVFE